MGVGTIAQYHHHDTCGGVFIYLSSSIEIGIGHDHDFDICHHDHEADHHEDEDCSLHLDDINVSREKSVLPLISVAATTFDYNFNAEETPNFKHKPYLQPCHDSKLISHAHLRAPPTMIG